MTEMSYHIHRLLRSLGKAIMVVSIRPSLLAGFTYRPSTEMTARLTLQLGLQTPRTNNDTRSH